MTTHKLNIIKKHESYDQGALLRWHVGQRVRNRESFAKNPRSQNYREDQRKLSTLEVSKLP